MLFSIKKSLKVPNKTVVNHLNSSLLSVYIMSYVHEDLTLDKVVNGNNWATLLRYQHFHLTDFFKVIHTWISRTLRILAMHEAEIHEIEEICNLCTFWPVTQLINHLFREEFKYKFAANFSATFHFCRLVSCLLWKDN